MARKESVGIASSRALADVLGIVLIAVALLFLLSLLSFDKGDVGYAEPRNEVIHNLAGQFGAWLATGLFFVFGAGAYVLPVLLLVFGLGYLFQFLAYLQHRWIWAVVLLVSCFGLLGLYSFASWLQDVQRHMNAPNAGGVLGLWAKDYVGGLFGRPGATIIFGTLYCISVLYLTNFQLGEWLRNWWANRPARRTGDNPWAGEERELEKKARELRKQARKLQDAVELSGIGADLQPVPEPTVRDLSQSQSKGARATSRAAALESRAASPASESKPPPESDEGVLEGEVIPAREIVAATTNQVLGREDKTRQKDEPPVAKKETDKEAVQPEAESGDEPPPVVSRPRGGSRKPRAITVAATPKIGNYQLPGLSILQHPEANLKPGETREELMNSARLMQSTLAQFGIEVALGDITKGPTITRYELHPAPGVKLEKISGLSNNIAAALKAERINILAPVPGKSSVGVEVPNRVKTKVIIRDLLESEEWQHTRARIPLALGKDVYGHPIIADLADMPHLLIAGSTGSGKSVCINSIIASLLYRFSPDELRFVMIDPKVVELQQYNALPHLVVPVVNDPKKVILALRWVVNEMEKRYQIFAKVGVRNIKSFNDRPKHKPKPPAEPELPLTVTREKVEAGSDGFAVELDEEIVVPRDEEIVIPEKLSYIVVIIDELADLMLVAPADVEMAIARITQMARAAGIHCIVATQRPSVDVITGVIKANIPARVAFQVAAKVDSRTILDAMGADKLLGKGDMLYLPPGAARLIRAQGVLITDPEIQEIVDFIARQGKPSYEVEIHQQLQKPVSSLDADGGSGEDEALIEQCVEIIRTEQKASVSLLQRRLRLGYTRAARLMDELESRGIVGPNKGAEPRDILVDLDGAGADGGGQQAV